MANYSESRSLERLGDNESGSGRSFGEEHNGWRPDWSDSGSQLPAGAARHTPGSVLLKVIEGEIIPRLLHAHRDPTTRPQLVTSVPQRPSAIKDLDSFARLVLTSGPHEIADRVQRLLDGGVRLDQIYADHLAPLARLLGGYWNEDRCSFAEVTLGLSRLHEVVHELGRRSTGSLPVIPTARRAFFAPAPGDHHPLGMVMLQELLGLAMLEELFRVSGWQTSSDHEATSGSIVQKLTGEQTDIVGFSVSCEDSLVPLTKLITNTRKTSRNREIVIMVGGRYLTDHPDVAANIGADSMVCGGDDVVRLAETLTSSSSRTCGKRTSI